jgi:hypothetical protein
MTYDRQHVKVDAAEMALLAKELCEAGACKTKR